MPDLAWAEGQGGLVLCTWALRVSMVGPPTGPWVACRGSPRVRAGMQSAGPFPLAQSLHCLCPPGSDDVPQTSGWLLAEWPGDPIISYPAPPQLSSLALTIPSSFAAL